MERLTVPDMMCEGCVSSVRQALAALPQVSAVRVDLARKLVEVDGDSPRERLLEAVRQAGFTPE